MIYCDKYPSPMGEITMLSNGKSLIGLHLQEQCGFHQYDKTLQSSELEVFKHTKQWLNLYFDRQIPPFTPHLHLEGSHFALSVWKILQTIPYGKTTTYKNIASIIAKQRNIPKMSAQAVGGAVGRNPIAIIIPCHRVIGTSNNLIGYTGGIQLKIKLLALEGNDMRNFQIPMK